MKTHTLRRALAVLLTLLMIGGGGIGLMPGASADGLDDWTFEVSSNKATITGYTGFATEVTTPTKDANNVAVTGIETGAFTSTSITKLTISEGITKIASGSFAGNTVLEEVVFPKSLSIIGTSGTGAFEGCTALTTIRFTRGTSAPTASIGASAFKDCTALVSIRIPSNFKTIGLNSFNGCSALTSVVLEEGGSGSYYIYAGAFANCRALTSIHIPTLFSSIASPDASATPPVVGAFDGSPDVEICTTSMESTPYRYAEQLDLDRDVCVAGSSNHAQPLKSYSMTVKNWDGSILVAATTREVGDTVELPTTEPTREGYTFEGWVVSSGTGSVSESGGVYTFTYAVNATTGNVSNAIVQPQFVGLDYSFSISGGTAFVRGTQTAAGTTAKAGDTFDIRAGDAPAGKVFDKWVVSSGTVTTATNKNTIFTMGAGNATVTATYKTDVPTAKSATTIVIPYKGSAMLEVATANSATNYTYNWTANVEGASLQLNAQDTTAKMQVASIRGSGYSGTATVTASTSAGTVTFNVTVQTQWWQWLIIVLLLGFLWY
ncbi:MAG: leucine-rich repeat protein [Oscillospiraceae bacterium]|nr:leucine-rich repeat protein [Oscillospiraceae bacterium]